MNGCYFYYIHAYKQTYTLANYYPYGILLYNDLMTGVNEKNYGMSQQLSTAYGRSLLRLAAASSSSSEEVTDW